MKTFVLLLVSFMPFVLFSQSKSSNVNIKKPMPSNNIVIAPESSENVLTQNTLNLEVQLIDENKSSDQLYSIRLSGFRTRSDRSRRLLLVEAQPILLTLSNGKVLEFNTVGAGIKEVNNSHSESHGIDDDLVFLVSREQINEIIQGKIVNVRFALNGTRMIDYKVENNRFSETLSQQLDILDGNENPIPGDIDRYLVPLQAITP
jgi:hypothetical protein